MVRTSDDTEEHDEHLLAPVREGESIANKYVAGRVLGVGGMGVVIAATDKVLGRKVAVKFLLPSLAHSERAVQRFVREARSASKITSEHVVKLLEIDTLPNGTPFFVMEYLEGSDLRQVLVETGPLPLQRAVDYLLQALEAIAEGHLHGVVHRDLKPSNLFVTRRADGSPIVKVLDFGIAKSLEPDQANQVGLTGSDDVRLGSPAYMSPEQLQRPGDVDLRSDIWSLGVTLYELVSGNLPFRGQTFADFILAVTTGSPEPLSGKPGDLSFPRTVNSVLLRCLEKDRTRRYGNVEELAAALVGFGTEQARASLKRIHGLMTSAGADGPYSVTVASEAPTPRAVVREAGARRSLAWTTRNATVAGLVVLVALGIVGVVWNRNSKPPSSPGPAEPALVQHGKPASERDGVPGREIPVVAPVPAPAPSPEPTIQPLPKQPDSANVKAVSRSAPSARPRTQERARAPDRSVTLTPAASAEPQLPPPAPTATPTPASTPENAEPSAPGRSETIEKLIERRR